MTTPGLHDFISVNKNLTKPGKAPSCIHHCATCWVYLLLSDYIWLHLILSFFFGFASFNCCTVCQNVQQLLWTSLQQQVLPVYSNDFKLHLRQKHLEDSGYLKMSQGWHHRHFECFFLHLLPKWHSAHDDWMVLFWQQMSAHNDQIVSIWQHMSAHNDQILSTCFLLYFRNFRVLRPHLFFWKMRFSKVVSCHIVLFSHHVSLWHHIEDCFV